VDAIDPPPGLAIAHAVRDALAALGPGLYGVACSGGADSIALVDAAITAAGPQHVVALTIDHGLHADSARIANAVAGWVRSRGAAAVVEQVTVARRASLEAAARDARYAALDRLADQLGLAVVLLGHTARDQAETVLLRLLRGTGPAGLAAIPRTRGRYLRPLLAVERDAIDAYIAARGLPTWDDPMNEELRLARVRVRRELLPLLRRENPQLDAALVRLAASAGEWLAVIDERARPLAQFPIDCHALAREPPAIRKRALALALDAAGLEHDAVHLEAIDRVVTAPDRGERRLDLPGGRLVRTYAHLALDVQPVAVELVAPAGPYVLRVWQPGDRMRPARLRGRSRKLSDLYIDAKVPRAVRAFARVLVRTTDSAIVWAEHVGIAHGEAESVAPQPTQMVGSF
jgi:tRNA(Ile)-lysidine synthase